MISLKKAFIDMTGREVAIDCPPRRIVSIVPSQTELLYDLGLRDEVVGITKFCVHPEEWFRNKRRVGGTKTVHIDIIRELQPDLIIANKEENTREQVEELSLTYPTWVSNIQTIEEGLQMIQHIAEITCRQEQGTRIITQVRDGFAGLSIPSKRLRVAYFIWRGPWMCAGGDTFISDVIRAIGWENALADKQRYPEVVLADLRGMDVDLVLLSSEPYPFKEKHIAEIQQELPRAKIMLVDGEMFSWYGSRMAAAVAYFSQLRCMIAG
jgi:ABC-type Fe3+-hydroxamate transport system substrate-binding protein